MNESGYQIRIRDLPTSERPRERLQKHGPSVLSDAELLGIVLRVGSRSESSVSLAQRLLSRFNGLEGLARATLIELQEERGLGPAKAAEVQATLNLGRRLADVRRVQRPTIRSPEDAADLLVGDMGLLEQEHLRVILLNVRHHVLGIREIYRGNAHSSSVRLGEVFRDAVRDNASSIVIAHNHPSGDSQPSDADIQLTRDARRAGELLNIEVLDHLIIVRKGFLSLKDKRLGFD